MDFRPAELIRKKRFGGTHSREELNYLIQEYAQDRLPDYQMSAWLMAVCLRGMTPQETAWLTQEMRDSGQVLNLDHLGATVDKHSTGGLGDKTSLLLAPIVAACGLRVPMMAGRGLGHTGGTLDKLESLPGYNVRLSLQEFETQVRDVGAAIIGQTREICPADRKLYALRDVTGTVDCLPLICASIMSKKLAEGMSALVLDVKFGSGAFMKTLDDADALARALVGIAQHAGKRATAVLSRMDEPLGRFIGNSLEVEECLALLEGRTRASGEGKDFSDTLELTLELAARMLMLGGQARGLDEGRTQAETVLRNGQARERFEQICRAQGADLVAPRPRARTQTEVKCTAAGFFAYRDLEALGFAAIELGAGRKLQDDVLDLSAGVEVVRVPGENVVPGDVLFILHHNEEARATRARACIDNAFTITQKPVARSPLIAKDIA